LAYFNTCDCFGADGRYRGAGVVLMKLIDRIPNSVYFLIALGLILLAISDWVNL